MRWTTWPRGRAHLAEALGEDPEGFERPLGSGYSQAAAHIEAALDGLRAAGDQEFVGRGLLARAALRRATGDYAPARTDLEEAAAIARRGEMRLFEADCDLEFARLCLAEGDKVGAREHLGAAKALVEATGYHRRDGEVAELEALLAD